MSDGDRALLRDIVSRRHAALVERVDEVGRRPLPPRTLDELRSAVVDEACEIPETAATARRILELEELLAGLAGAPRHPARDRAPRRETRGRAPR